MMVNTSELSEIEAFKSLTRTGEGPVTIDTLLQRVTCDNENCQLGLEECGECEDGMQTFKTDLISICGKEGITHVKYKQWMFTDNDQKQDITAEVTEYTENLGNSC